MSTLYDLSAQRLDGSDQAMAEFAGKVLLFVNVASKCGFTSQYAGLESLWRHYRDRGFFVLGFPCNQFGAQEPGDEASIGQFCKTTYDVTFPMFAKIDVNGHNAHPLYRQLKTAAPGVLSTEAIKWNFTKFLVDRTGQEIVRYASATKPEQLTKNIELLL